MLTSIAKIGLGLTLLAACSKDGTGPVPTDTTPPAAVTDLARTGPLGRTVVLTWTSPGDDGVEGQAATYDLRASTVIISEASWDSAAVVDSLPSPKTAGQPEQLELGAIPDGRWFFAIRTSDEAGNRSGLSNVVESEVADVVAPAPVTDLRAAGGDETSVELSWTAPGNDGIEGRAASYDLRYSEEFVTEANWSTALIADGLPAPSTAGTEESFRVTGLVTGRSYYFAIRAADARPNWSPISNVVSAAAVDATPPWPIADLYAAAIRATWVTLTWTAPGDDGMAGRAAEYDLRRATSEITAGSWESAVRVEGAPSPDSASSPQTMTVRGLVAGEEYFFALKTADSSHNWSGLSNVIAVAPDSVPLRRLTTAPGSFTGSGARGPSWSPDGTRIAFYSDWSNIFRRTEIYVVPTTGGSPLQLTDDPNLSNAWPSWSPDGTRLAYASGPPFGAIPTGVWAMNASDGSGAAQLASAEDGVVTGTSWSPDGLRIAYTVRTAIGSPLYLQAIAGGSPFPVTGATQRAQSPAWSPDGTKIALAWDPTGTLEIWVVSPDGLESTQLTRTNGGLSGYPTWSPDGNLIAFSAALTGDNEIYVMPAEGGELTRLTFDPGSDTHPSWSPDGSQIALASDRSGHYEIWLMFMDQ